MITNCDPWDRIFNQYLTVMNYSFNPLFSYLGKVYTNDPETASLLGVVKGQMNLTPLQDLKLVTDFE